MRSGTLTARLAELHAEIREIECQLVEGERRSLEASERPAISNPQDAGGRILVLDRHGHLEEERTFGSWSPDDTADQLWYTDYLAEREAALRRARKHGPRGPFWEPPPLDGRAPVHYVVEWTPQDEGARRFWMKTLDYVHRPKDRGQHALGQRGLRMIWRLLLLLGKRGSGRPWVQKDLERYRPEVFRLRPLVLQDAQQVVRASRPSADGAAEDYEEYQVQLQRLIARYLPKLPPPEATRRAAQLVRRKALRPVDITNQILAWMLSLRPAEVQVLASGQ